LWLLLHEDRTAAAIFLAVYGAGIVSTIDNVIKPLVLHGQANLHPLLALLSVLGGVQAFGPIDFFVGPMVVAFLHTILKIVQVAMTKMDESKPFTV
jgi:predicted PurR-regulated permease PerM